MKRYFSLLSTYIKTHKKTDLVVLALGIGVFLIITLLNVSRASIWFDEAFGIYVSQFSFWEIARYTAVDVHPPLYYWVLKVWSAMFGTTELAYRSLSILFGTGIIATSFFLARKMFGRRVAWLTLAFLAISPMLIRYSDEARMYTMGALIVMGATWVMLRAQETKKKSLWIWYGVLVSLGMWTHYLTALAWIAHWLWRAAQKWQKGSSLKQYWKAIFSKEWTLAYSLAVALYIPWIPALLWQFGVVQFAGFWIGPVGVDTPANYLTNYFYYLEHGQVQSWMALALLVVVGVVIALAPRAFKALTKKERTSFSLISMLAFAPPVLLFLLSLPPLRPSFVDRYLISSIIALSMFLAVVLIVGSRKWKFGWRALAPLAIVAMMAIGITNVYYYGNFNKNSNTHILTRHAVRAAQELSEPGVPIVASSPWLLYEAAPYATKEHPVYFIDENTEYIFGSLEMLRLEDVNKIKDLTAFEKQNPVIWYLGMTSDEDVPAYKDSWQKIRTITTTDHITGKSQYKITQYRVSGFSEE